MTAILAFVVGVGLSPIVENVPGVNKVQAFVRKAVQYVRDVIRQIP